MKKIFFFFIALLFISIVQAQNIPRTDPNAANLPVATNLPVALSLPSVTIVNDPVLPLYNQTWMQKNLNVTKYRNGDPIPQVADPAAWAVLTTGAWCWYNNDPANGKIYGKLYNWYAVNDPRRLAPEGWHIPTDAEWTDLVTCLYGELVAGGNMKAPGRTIWAAPNFGATNSSGFSGLPGGYRSSSGTFETVSNDGRWWSSTEIELTFAWSRHLYYNNRNIGRNDSYKLQGFSVRCIRD